jgi:hypothetical protein
MSTDLWHELVPVDLTADLSGEGSKFKAVAYGGTIAANTNVARGILRYGAKSGERASVSVIGIFKAQFGTAVNTVGFPLKITTSGFVVACASGDNLIGRSISLTASGDIAQASFNFLGMGYWPG